MIKKRKKLRRRPVLLLEVLIAFVLVVLCVIPLIYPHVYMVKLEKEFIGSIDADHVANALYAQLYEKLQKNEIPWDKLLDKTPVVVDDAVITEINNGRALPYKVSYQFEELNHKPKTPQPLSVYLFKVTYLFNPKIEKSNEDKSLKYSYQVFIARNLPQAAAAPKEPENGKDGKKK
jgi:hypothetical protein